MGDEQHTNGLDKKLEQLVEDQHYYFSELKKALIDGLNNIAREIRTNREIGILPLPVVESLMHAKDKTFGAIIKTLCWIMLAMVAWFTGVKYFLPHILQ